MDIRNIVKNRIKSIDECKFRAIIDAIKAIPYFKKLPKELPEGIYLEGWGTSIILVCVNFDHLHNARDIMRKVFKTWTDKDPHIAHDYGDKCHIDYRDKEHSQGTIRVMCTMSTLPEGFTKNGCTWEKSSYHSETLLFVCPVKK